MALIDTIQFKDRVTLGRNQVAADSSRSVNEYATDLPCQLVPLAPIVVTDTFSTEQGGGYTAFLHYNSGVEIGDRAVVRHSANIEETLYVKRVGVRRTDFRNYTELRLEYSAA